MIFIVLFYILNIDIIFLCMKNIQIIIISQITESIKIEQ